ncbi:hypothetical protein ABT340_39240 [Streptosporangium sp. NPDC000239]|uniref:hypothetical protein n=1 Tax=Streptosporangium sp. NPDC000239 TaxID=3154248 RepID=UPI00332A40B2
MNAPITLTLSPLMLTALVPDGASLEGAWVVLLGDHDQIGTHDGRPVYAPAVTSWQLVMPCPTEAAAVRRAELLGTASLGGAQDEWRWYSDDDGQMAELWGLIDGDEVPTEVAIAPLTALLHKAGE